MFHATCSNIGRNSTIALTSIRNVNFIALYKEGWSKIGTLPEQKLNNFFSSDDSSTNAREGALCLRQAIQRLTSHNPYECNYSRFVWEVAGLFHALPFYHNTLKQRPQAALPLRRKVPYEFSHLGSFFSSFFFRLFPEYGLGQGVGENGALEEKGRRFLVLPWW